MGNRAQYIIVADDDWQVYYSHWGAVALEFDILAGPDSMTRLILAQEAQPRDVRKWTIDNLWCDGAALLDHDTRTLLCYWLGTTYSARAASFAVLSRTWPGWQVVWAYGGVADLADYVGVDGDRLREANVEPIEPKSAAEDCIGCLVTVTDVHGTRAYATNVSSESILCAGPDIVDRLPADALVDACLVVPHSGCHLDYTTKRAGAWTSSAYLGRFGHVRARWPGWLWEFWSDDYECHVAHAEGGVTIPPVDLRAALLELPASLSRTRELLVPVPAYARNDQRVLDAVNELIME